MTLTKQQREVVEADTGHIVVLAGPGSGKTHTITEKIAYLFGRAVIPEPYGLLAVTFTDAAAREMRSRLRTKGFRQWDRVWVGTFHSFGRYLLSCYGSDIGIREDFEIIEPDDQIGLLGRIIPARGGWTPWDLKAQFERLKRQGIYPGLGDDREDEDLRLAYQEYQRFLSESNMLDFGDLIALAVQLLQESNLARQLYTGFFRYVIVDEFQDTDPQQLEMIRILAETAIGSTIVADDDQSIYRFRGARRANIYAIEEMLGAKRIILGQNFRSDQVIVEAAMAVIGHEANRAPKNVVAVSQARGHLFRCEFPDPEEEAQQVVKWIVKALDERQTDDPGEIAVITRNHWRADWMLKEMDKVNVPWFDRARLKFQDSWETTLGLAVLALACDLNSSERFYQVMTAVEDGGLAFRLGDEDALDVARRIRDRLAATTDLTPDPATGQTILDIAGFREIVRMASAGTSDARRRITNLRKMVADVAQEAHKHGLDLAGVVNRLSGYGAVQVMSGHQSKCREFDLVFFVGLEDDVLPSYRAHEEDEIAEERRIFYVGLTRARRAAYLTSAAQRPDRYGRIWSKAPSRFLDHIPNECFSSLPAPTLL